MRRINEITGDIIERCRLSRLSAGIRVRVGAVGTPSVVAGNGHTSFGWWGSGRLCPSAPLHRSDALQFRGS
jgi:hypothetical protein